MPEQEKKKKKITIKPFNYKWYQFLIIYGILNILFFMSIKGIIDYVYGNPSNLFTSDVYVDGADFSPLVNLLASPLVAIMTLLNIGFCVLEEFVVILLFRFGYFISTVKNEEKNKLLKYIKISLLCFMLGSLIILMFSGYIHHIVFFILLYLPVLLFTFLFICLKLKKSMITENM